MKVRMIVAIWLSLTLSTQPIQACDMPAGGLDLTSFWRCRLAEETADFDFTSKNGLRKKACEHARIAKDITVTLRDQNAFDLWKQRETDVCKGIPSLY